MGFAIGGKRPPTHLNKGTDLAWMSVGDSIGQRFYLTERWGNGGGQHMVFFNCQAGPTLGSSTSLLQKEEETI